MNQHHPFHPIIYVRGFAATHGEIEEAVADPYMGFNIGSTKSRMLWTGDLKRFFFESPLVRLMGEYDYNDVFVQGDDLLTLDQSDEPLDYKCIIIYRYYDEGSEAFGIGETPPIQHFAKGLNDLILRLGKKVCENDANKVSTSDFRCYLVAHSMGGLVCRAFLQGVDDNGKPLGQPEARQAVDKIFTYATPHNGIDLRIVRNVPAWATFGDVHNFNRQRMAVYLGLNQSDDVSIVQGFQPDRIFNLVGTDSRDYLVLGGLSAWAAGETSDGLVRIENATTHGQDAKGEDVQSPRAFVHRSHSGHYGIVNSEEGYQNMTRFFFGTVRVDGILDVDEITLPPAVQKEFDNNKVVRASYQFEIVVSVRGCRWQMHRRTMLEHSAIFRTYDELFPESDGSRKPNRQASPHLFSVFLDPSKSVKTTGSVSFAFDVRVLVPDYEIDGVLFLKQHYEGGFIYRKLIVVEAWLNEKSTEDWKIKYGFQDETPAQATKTAETRSLGAGEGLAFDIPILQDTKPGLKGTLRIQARPWT